MGYRKYNSLNLESRLNKLEKENKRLKENEKLLKDEIEILANDYVRFIKHYNKETNKIQIAFKDIEIFRQNYFDNRVIMRTDILNIQLFISRSLKKKLEDTDKKLKNIDNLIRFIMFSIIVMCIIDIAQKIQ